MTDAAKQALHAALKENRAGMVAKLDGLGEYDVRRPLTPTATNLLGLVKHLAGVEYGYFGDSFGRPPVPQLPWVADGSVWDSADMWATPDETTQDVLEVYRRAWAHADRTIEDHPLDAPARVPWWKEGRQDTTLGVLLVRVLVDTARHAGQADIIRELVDGRGGDDHELQGDADWWAAYYDRVAAAAASFHDPR
jgi:uncharacterized damage-inducible protein DinB